MHKHYRDILDRIPAPPLWFDENAVPRYAPFDPRELANIYAQESVLAVVACQGCQREFNVAFSEMNLAKNLWSKDRKSKIRNISDLIADGTLSYGDPPNVDCCPVGPTMGSIAQRVVEYWYKPIIRGEGLTPTLPGGRKTIIDLKALDFKRDPTFEIHITGPKDDPPRLIPIRTRFAPKG